MSRILLEALAERLACTPNALYCRLHRGEHNLPPVKRIPGDRRYWFDEDQVEEWLENPDAFKPKEKRGPGRPRKHDPHAQKSIALDVRRGRGRPRESSPESQLNSR